MATNYTPRDWYWFVGGDETQAYSSRLGDYVPADNPDFQAFLALGRTPTRILNEAELGEVVAGADAPQPVAAGVLNGYLIRKVSAADRALARTLFNVVNRVLALEGNPPVTWGQFVNYVKQQAQE